MRTIIGIDIGGSTTKIVGFRSEGSKHELISTGDEKVIYALLSFSQLAIVPSSSTISPLTTAMYLRS